MSSRSVALWAKWWLWGMACCLLATGCSGEGARAADETTAAAVAVEVLSVQEREEALTRRYTGYVHPWQAHGIGFLVGGRVKSILVKEGDKVEKGQLIATMVADDFALTQSLAAVHRDALAPNLERVRTLVEERVLPRSELDRIQAEYDAAVTQWKRARRQTDYATLHSPVDGVIHERQSSEGQIVGSGTPVVIVLDLSRVKVKVGVTQSELQYFALGARYDVHFPGTEIVRQGVVTHVDFVSDTQTRTFDVSLEVENGDGVIFPSMLAHFERVTERYRGLFVPLHAVQRGPKGALLTVVDPESATVEKREVSLGALLGDQVEVRAGLQAGELVVVAGHDFVKAGQKVVWP